MHSVLLDDIFPSIFYPLTHKVEEAVKMLEGIKTNFSQQLLK